MDVALPHTHPTSSPHVADFVTRVLERLKPLTSEAEIRNHVHEENAPESADERTQAVKLLKTGQNTDSFLCLAKLKKQNYYYSKKQNITGRQVGSLQKDFTGLILARAPGHKVLQYALESINHGHYKNRLH